MSGSRIEFRNTTDERLLASQDGPCSRNFVLLNSTQRKVVKVTTRPSLTYTEEKRNSPAFYATRTSLPCSQKQAHNSTTTRRHNLTSHRSNVNTDELIQVSKCTLLTKFKCRISYACATQVEGLARPECIYKVRTNFKSEFIASKD